MERDHTPLLEAFASHLRNRKKEVSTVALYVKELEGLLMFLQNNGIELFGATPQHLLRYRDALSAGGMKPSTINKRMSIARSFFRWAGGEGLANPSAAEGLRLDTAASAPVRWLSDEEERALLAAAANETGDERGARNEALLASMLFAGLRLKEVSYLRMESVQSSRLLVYDKSKVVRIVPLDDRALTPLLRWRRHRAESVHAKHRRSSYLFVTERSGFMQPRAVQFAVESLSAKAGFAVRCGMLRHTYCRRLAREGASVECLREWAGHRSTQSAIRYFDELERREGVTQDR